MNAGQVPSQHLPAPTAFYTGDVVLMDRSADRYCWRSLLFDWLTEAHDRLVHGGDEPRQLVRWNLIMPSKCNDNLGRKLTLCSR